jgi:DNA-binding NtrC family response regulator
MATATVLFVEDEALISDLVCDVLTERGFDVHLEDTADGALRYLENGYEIDVLFTDINLPGDIDGAELANRARELRPELAVIYASGRLTPSEIGALVPRSVFVNKPYDLGDLCKLIRRLAPTKH